MKTTKFYAEEKTLKGNKLSAGPRKESNRSEKYIGIEIEFFGVTAQTVIDALRNEGLKVRNFAGYTHAVTDHWKVTTDASVNNRGTGLRQGLELVSPPLNEKEMTEQLFIATRVLENVGADVDKTCGIHVHHEIDDLKVNDVKNIFKIYYKHEFHIEKIMPTSRRRLTSSRFCRGLNPEEISHMENASSIRQIAEAQSTRFRTININSYLKYGTVEFRQHSGSLDFEKLINWVKITQAIVETAKRKKNIADWKNQSFKDVTSSNRQFVKTLDLMGTEQSAYILNRKDTFSTINKSQQAAFEAV